MRLLSCAAALVVAAASAIAQIPSAFATVTAQELNLRAGPTPQSPIVGKLRQGQSLLVQPGVGPWVRVSVLIDGVMKEGWVNRSFISVSPGQARPAAPAPVPAPAPAPNVFATAPRAASPQVMTLPQPLTIDSADLDCEEDFIDGGLDDCTVEVSVTIYVPQPYAILAKDYVDVECEAEVRFQDADGFSISESQSETSSIYLSNGNGSESIDISVDPFSMSPIVRASVEDVGCEIHE